MVIDYKGVTFSFKAQKRKRFIKRLRVVFLVFLIICGYFFMKNWFDAGAMDTVQELLLSGDVSRAEEEFKGIEDSFYHQTSKRELKALIRFFTDAPEEAREILASVESRGSRVAFEEFLDYFSDYAKYRALRIYTEYMERQGESLPYYRAMAATALFDPKGSAAAIETITPEQKPGYEKELGLIDRVNRELLAGRVNYVFDVNGKPLAYYDLEKGKTGSLAPGFRFNEFTGEFKESIKFYSLTVDLRVQEMLHRLFSRHGYHGTFLLLNLDDTGITAAYSRPAAAWKGNGNAIFEELYEPGSIIKVLTLFAYLHLNGEDFFPYDCKGTTPMNGHIFYDWFRHDTIHSFNEALAVSCNICFAKMGTNQGVGKLGAVWDKFYFGGEHLEDLFISFRTGSYNKTVANNYEMARLSVGLDQVSITTFHAGLISAMIARSGSVYSPYLVKSKKNLLQLAYYRHPQRLIKTVENNPAYLKVKDAMVQVVEDVRGTGRRSKTEGLNVALKTGTAGNKGVGFDAILIGFFPAEKPHYAFAFRLQHVGKAELKGAYFLKEFLEAFQKK